MKSEYYSEVSPEHLYYNIWYHVHEAQHETEEERDNAIKNLIFGSIKKCQDSNQ